MADKHTNTQPASHLLDFLLGASPSAPGNAKSAKESSGGILDLLLGAPPVKKPVVIPAGDGGEVISEEELAITEKRYQEGLQKVLDIIAPSGMEVSLKHITLGGETLARSFFVYNWPSQIHLNWLAPIVNYDATMDIAQFIYPASSQVVMRMLRRKVAEMRSSLTMRREKGLSRDPQLEAALEDAEQLRDMLARGHEKLFQFGLYFTIYADTEEKMKKIQAELESILGGKLVLTKPADFQMEHGWNSTLPLCLDEIEMNRNMNTSPLSTSFPFTSSDLTSDKGILYGINRHNESLVIFDRFSLPNANSTVFATSGAGKSYAVKLEVIRSLMMDTAVYIIDPENEYTELAQVVGGGIVPVSLRSPYRINPFDLPKSVAQASDAGADDEDARTEELLRSAVINLHGLFKLMLGATTPDQEATLDKAILDTYALKGITLETKDPGHMEPPTLHDLVDVLMTTEGGEGMAKIFKKFTEGSFAGLFSEKTNINLSSQLMVFQTRDLEESLRPMAIYIVLNYLWNEVRSELKKRLIIMDEAWNIMQYEDSARFLYGLIKRARKYYLGITTITQDVEDFMNSPYGKPIVTNAAMQFLLKQAPSAIKVLQEAFNLTEGEKYFLLNSGVGQGVFFAGHKHVAVQIVASPKEHEIVTTNPEEISRRRADAVIRKQEEEKTKKETGATPAPEQSSVRGAAKESKEHPAQSQPTFSSSEPGESRSSPQKKTSKPTTPPKETSAKKPEDLFPEPPAEEKGQGLSTTTP